MHDFDISKLDGHTLRLFLSVCETSSISRTAAMFDLNQSTVSHALEKLRHAMGDALFVKVGRGIEPTERAMAMIPRLQRIVAEIEGLVSADSYSLETDPKPLSVAIATPALAQDIRRLHQSLISVSPEAELILRRLAPRQDIERILADDEADVAIAVHQPSYPATLCHAPYGHERLAIFYDPQQRGPITSIEDFLDASHGIVCYGGKDNKEVSQVAARFGAERKVKLVAPAVTTLAYLIKGTDIIATMPQRLASMTSTGLAYCLPPFDIPDLRYDLVWHRRYEHSGRNTWLRHLALNVGHQIYGPPG